MNYSYRHPPGYSLPSLSLHPSNHPSVVIEELQPWEYEQERLRSRIEQACHSPLSPLSPWQTEDPLFDQDPEFESEDREDEYEIQRQRLNQLRESANLQAPFLLIMPYWLDVSAYQRFFRDRRIGVFICKARRDLDDVNRVCASVHTMSATSRHQIFKYIEDAWKQGQIHQQQTQSINQSTQSTDFPCPMPQPESLQCVLIDWLTLRVHKNLKPPAIHAILESFVGLETADDDEDSQANKTQISLESLNQSIQSMQRRSRRIEKYLRYRLQDEATRQLAVFINKNNESNTFLSSSVVTVEDLKNIHPASLSSIYEKIQDSQKVVVVPEIVNSSIKQQQQIKESTDQEKKELNKAVIEPVIKTTSTSFSLKTKDPSSSSIPKTFDPFDLLDFFGSSTQSASDSFSSLP